MKGFGMIVFLVLVLSLFSTAVFSPGIADFVNIDQVKVNGMTVDENRPVHLERGQNVYVEVFFTGNPYSRCETGTDNPCYDARIEVEIQGYEYGEVRDVEGPFEIEPGVSDRRVLSFVLPEDMPASDNLNLNVEIKDDDDVVFVSFPLRIQEVRHKLNIFDVVLNPANNVQAGQALFVSARVENIGDNSESSIRVTAAIPSLGIQTSEYIDRLGTFQNEDDEEVDDAATTNELLLLIPANAAAGDYQLVVSADYNRGHSSEEKAYTISINGVNQAPITGGADNTGVVVNIESETLRVRTGEGAVYKFSIANLNQAASSFRLDVVGANSWSNVRVDPEVVVVQPNGVQNMYVFVAPNQDVEGSKTFSVNVMSGDEVLSESQLILDVVEAESGTAVRTVFTWIFAILLIILVILVIVVVAKKVSGSKEGGIEGQTYY